MVMEGLSKQSGKQKTVAPRRPFAGRRRFTSSPKAKAGQTTSAGHEPFPTTIEPESLVIVGRITKVIGLDGWVKVLTLSDNPERFEAGSVVLLKTETAVTKPLRVARIRGAGSVNSVGVLFEGFTSREDVSELVGRDLFVHAKDRMPLEEDRFYSDEVTGMVVLSPEGEPVGTVLSLESEAPSPYLVVQSPTHGEVFIPFRKAYILSIDRILRQVRLGEPIQSHVLE